jgi:glucose/arabinose dehydrogenase
MSFRGRAMRCLLVGALLLSAMASSTVVPAAAGPLPSGFQEQIVFTGLLRPTNIEFSRDGRVFVAEQRGTIKVFDDLYDPTPAVFADLTPVVHGAWDRGLLGMALAPNFPVDPWVYVLYTYDAPPGQTAPYWYDTCTATDGTCVVTARLSRLRAAGNQMTGSEQVLVSDWCQQFGSHSIGDLKFGADGALYVSADEGANFTTVDYGQLGNPANPCGDPPGGTSMTPPTAEGGSLRSQDVRSPPTRRGWTERC